jgi:hypothetical protein
MHVPLHITSAFVPLTGLPVVIFYFLSYHYGLYLNGGSESGRNITEFIHIY